MLHCAYGRADAALRQISDGTTLGQKESVPVVSLMRPSGNWDDFYRLLQRSFPKKNDQFSLFTSEEKDD